MWTVRAIFPRRWWNRKDESRTSQVERDRNSDNAAVRHPTEQRPDQLPTRSTMIGSRHYFREKNSLFR
jgi:hypothetical protein